MTITIKTPPRTTRRLPLIKPAAMVAMICAALVLAGCASSRPANVNDACAIFDEKGGWFNNWYRYSRKAEKEFGVPVPIMLATIHQESRFNAKAKPPRRKLLGFIPWFRPSSAYGYPQAKKETWKWYREKSGNRGADRDKFKDAVHFVGWYHHQTHLRNGVAKHDAYNLYLAYHEGHGGFEKKTYARKGWLMDVANKVAAKSREYEAQLRLCGR